MRGTESLWGSFETPTELKRLDNGWWEASALGEKAVHYDQAQAINDLNAKLDEKITTGDIQPDLLGG